MPCDMNDGNEDTLGNALAALHRDGFLTEIVDLHHQFVALATIILIDDTYAMRTEETFATGSTAVLRIVNNNM